MYADYIEEREGAQIVQTASGFATFRLEKDHSYLLDLYVAPEARGTGAAQELFEIVIAHTLEAGLTRMAGSVVPSTKGAHRMMEIMLGRGFKLYAAEKDIVYFMKELK
jgi:GNAT superfamily N-acetyltransferase